MALTENEEIQLRDLLTGKVQLDGLIDNYSSILSKLGASQVTLADLGLITDYAIGDETLVVRDGTAKRLDVGALVGGAGAYANAKLYAAYTGGLDAVTGAAGDYAVVVGEAGTHTDPVTAATVSNKGMYQWSASPAGWKWIATLESISAQESADLAEAWAESPTAPDPLVPTSKSAKTWAADAAEAASTAGEAAADIIARKNFPIVDLQGIGGTANDITVDLPDGMTDYVNGQSFRLFPLSSCTGAATIKFGSLQAISIVTSNFGALSAGDLRQNQAIVGRITGAPGAPVFRISGTSTLPREVISDPAMAMRFSLEKITPLVQLTGIAGSANSITATAPSQFTAYASGQFFYFFAAATSTSSVTLNIGGIGSMPITDVSGVALGAGDIVAGSFYLLRVSGASDRFSVVAQSIYPNKLTFPTRPVDDASTYPANTSFVDTAKNKPIKSLIVSGSATAWTAAFPSGVTALTSGQIFAVRNLVAENTGTLTLNIGGLGALEVKDSSGNSLQAGDVPYGQWLVLRNVSGTEYHIIASGNLPRTTLANTPRAEMDNIRAQLPNLFTAGEVDTTEQVRTRAGYGVVPTAGVATLPNGEKRPAWRIAGGIGDSGVKGAFLGPFSRDDFDDSGKLSAAVQVLSVGAFTGSGTHGGRVILSQYDGTMTEILAARQTISSFGNGGLTRPTWFKFENVAWDASAEYCVLYVEMDNTGGTTTRDLYFADMLICSGATAIYRRPLETVKSAQAVAYVGPSGSDGNSGTTAAAPLASIDAALTAIGGNGTVYVLPGAYGVAARLTPSKVTGKVRIVGVRPNGDVAADYDNFPIIRVVDKLTGITKTAGQTKVYQTTLSGPPTLANFRWAYQDGVADPRTVATADEQRWIPDLRGKDNFLPYFARLMKTTATTLAAALAEIDATAEPCAFIDDSTGILYFSIVGGGDGTGANIYIDKASTSLVKSGASKGTCGDIEIIGLDVRYGGIDLRPFRHAFIDQVFVRGASNNCVDYFNLRVGMMHGTCSGSQQTTSGDILNGHGGGKLLGCDYLSGWYGNDDLFSDHEGCTSRLLGGGFGAYMGGTCLAPAYGSDHVSSGFISYRNQRRTGGYHGRYKPGAIAVIGDPTEAGSIADGGTNTCAIFRNHISIEDNVGFYDDKSAGDEAYGWAINCKAIRPAYQGFDISKATDCSYLASGTSSATSARTIVETTVPLV